MTIIANVLVSLTKKCSSRRLVMGENSNKALTGKRVIIILSYIGNFKTEYSTEATPMPRETSGRVSCECISKPGK